MNIKERIIRSKLERLDPLKDAALIARLSAELARPPQTELPREQLREKSDDAPEFTLFAPLTHTNVGNFRSLDTDVFIRSTAFGDIWLVPERTGAARFELLPEELLALNHARKIFDARIVEVTKNVPA